MNLKINKDSLPIKFILDNYYDLPNFPDEWDLLYLYIKEAQLNPWERLALKGFDSEGLLEIREWSKQGAWVTYWLALTTLYVKGVMKL